MGEGKTYAFSIPLLPTSIMVTDPVCLEYLLKRKAHNFIKGPRFYLVGITDANYDAGLTALPSSHSRCKQQLSHQQHADCMISSLLCLRPALQAVLL